MAADVVAAALQAQSKKLCEEKATRRRTLQDAQHSCLQAAKQYSDAALQDRHALREMTGLVWKGFPHLCPAVTAVSSASDVALHKDDASRPLHELSQAWTCRHDGIPAARPEKQRLPDLPSCLQQGCCLCGRGHASHRLLLNAFLNGLKREWPRKTSAEPLEQARVVVSWYSPTTTLPGSDADGLAEELLFTYVPVMYFKPYRPTLLLLGLTGLLTDDFAEQLLAGFQEEPFLSLEVVTEAKPGFARVPAFRSLHEFVKSLDVRREWFLRFWTLSTRHRLVGLPPGQVVVVGWRFGEPASQVWNPKPEETLGAVWLSGSVLGLGGALASADAGEGQEQEAAQSDVNGSDGDIGEAEDSPAEGDVPPLDGDAGSESEADHGLPDGLLAQLDLARSESSTSSSTSSSESSSSDSSSSEDSSSSTTSEGEAGNAAPSDIEARDAASEAPSAGTARQRRAETFMFGPFLFTYRPAAADTGRAGYQVTCRVHKDGGAPCTKTASYPVADDLLREQVVRRLKSWCLRAPQAATKREHQGSRSLPEEDLEHRHLSHEALDALALEIAV